MKLEKQGYLFSFRVATRSEKKQIQDPYACTSDSPRTKAHRKPSGPGLDRDQGRPNTQTTLCYPEPSGYKEFRDSAVSIIFQIPLHVPHVSQVAGTHTAGHI